MSSALKKSKRSLKMLEIDFSSQISSSPIIQLSTDSITLTNYFLQKKNPFNIKRTHLHSFPSMRLNKNSWRCRESSGSADKKQKPIVITLSLKHSLPFSEKKSVDVRFIVRNHPLHMSNYIIHKEMFQSSCKTQFLSMTSCMNKLSFNL